LGTLPLFKETKKDSWAHCHCSKKQRKTVGHTSTVQRNKERQLGTLPLFKETKQDSWAHFHCSKKQRKTVGHTATVQRNKERQLGTLPLFKETKKDSWAHFHCSKKQRKTVGHIVTVQSSLWLCAECLTPLTRHRETKTNHITVSNDFTNIFPNNCAEGVRNS
jgi:hypothetical protein